MLVYFLSSIALFMLSSNFRSWTKWRKYNIFWWFKLMIFGLWRVKHDLETWQRPWFTQILTLWASQGPQNRKWNLKKYCTLHKNLMDENYQTTWTSKKSCIETPKLIAPSNVCSWGMKKIRTLRILHYAII